MRKGRASIKRPAELRERPHREQINTNERLRARDNSHPTNGLEPRPTSYAASIRLRA
jgi:hypothetical protein